MGSDKLPIEVRGHSDKLSIEALRHSVELIQIEVAYARPDRQILIPLAMGAGATVEEAIHCSGVLQNFPEINLDVNKVGIFGKRVKLNARLRTGDRVEIYRPLPVDPKEMRRQRVMQGKKSR